MVRIPAVRTIGWQQPIKEVVSDLPVSPKRGDRYIKGIYIYECLDTNPVDWDEIKPKKGWHVWDEDRGVRMIYDGSDWYDEVWAIVEHDHDDTYSLSSHDHDEDYAPYIHDHDELYSVLEHVHTGIYEPVLPVCEVDDYVLASNAQNGRFWVAMTGGGGGGEIGGSGETNKIAKFTGATNIGDSRIFDNGTSFGFGLGNNSPLVPFHVVTIGTVAFERYGTAQSILALRRANGTHAAPTNLIANDICSAYSSAGYYNGFQTIGTMRWVITSVGVSRLGTKLEFMISSPTGTTFETGMTLNDNKSLQVVNIPARTTAATTILTHDSGLLQCRAVADILSDIGAASIFHDHVSLYAPIIHNHVELYSPLAHKHGMTTKGDMIVGDADGVPTAISIPAPYGWYMPFHVKQETPNGWNAGITSTYAKIGDGLIAIKESTYAIIKVQFGTESNQVAEGNHLHTGVYSLTDHDHGSIYAPYTHEHPHNHTFADLDGLNISSLDEGDFLYYNNTNWVNTNILSYRNGVLNTRANIKVKPDDIDKYIEIDKNELSVDWHRKDENIQYTVFGHQRYYGVTDITEEFLAADIMFKKTAEWLDNTGNPTLPWEMVIRSNNGDESYTEAFKLQHTGELEIEDLKIKKLADNGVQNIGVDNDGRLIPVELTNDNYIVSNVITSAVRLYDTNDETLITSFDIPSDALPGDIYRLHLDYYTKGLNTISFYCGEKITSVNHSSIGYNQLRFTITVRENSSEGIIAFSLSSLFPLETSCAGWEVNFSEGVTINITGKITEARSDEIRVDQIYLERITNTITV